jgi:hypothetical protein
MGTNKSSSCIVTIREYNKAVTRTNKGSLATELCRTYASKATVAIDTNDFLGLLNNGSTLSVVEINGDHIEDMMQELAKHPCSSNPLIMINSNGKHRITVGEVYSLKDWIAELPDNTDVIWGLGVKRSIPCKLQIAVFTVAR